MTRRLVPAGVLAFALGHAFAAFAAAQPTLESFLAEPVVRAVALSPRGDRVAYLLREEHAARLGVLETAGGERRTWLLSERVADLHWRPDGEGLFLEAADQVAYLADEAGSRPALVARLDERRGQSFAGVDPALPDAALLREHPQGGPHRLLRLDAGGGTRVLHESGERFGAVILNDGGRVAFVQTTEGRQVVVRQAVDGGWREVMRCGVADACVPVTVETAAGLTAERLLLRRRGAAGRWELAALDLSAGEGRGGVETVHRDPLRLADLAEVARDPLRGTPLLAVYDTDRRRSYALDPALEAPLQRLADLLPERDLFLEARAPGGTWLVTEADPRLQRPRHHLYDVAAGRLRPILEAERRRGVTLEPASLARRRHLSYRAADGLLVHGFVSVPPRFDPSQAPLVVLVHGGPWNHARSRFDTLYQFLASRGYVVFEPNFRGSTGYGFDYMRAARGEFADGRVHQDVLDGVDHLLARGLGDPRRVAIVGHSFGGYATLGALAWSPRRFRAGVAMAPPIDLVRALGDLDENVTLPNGLPLLPLLADLLADFSDPRAVADLRSRSPEACLAATERPVLILAGGRDHLVDRVDVEHYALALDELGRDVSLLMDDDRGHNFESRLMRHATLYLLERFLARHLEGSPGPTGPPADRRLAAYLAYNLRLVGDDFGVLVSAPQLPRTGG